MTREYWMRKLKDIVARLEAAATPSIVREIYVFGSFARGALDPKDLDLIVVHEPPTVETLAPLLEAVKSYSYDHLDQAVKAEARFNAAMRRVFRRGSERIDVLTGQSLPEILAGYSDIPREEVKLIWSDRDRDRETKLAAIRPVESAGRHPRNHFIDVRRTQSTVDDVLFVTELIDSKALNLQCLPLKGVGPRLNREFQQWLAHWTRVRAVGADALKVLPWAMWWIQEQGVMEPHLWQRTELGDRDGKFLVQLVRLYPAYIPALFARKPEMIRHCLLPRWRVRETNILYVFDRGPNWPGSYPKSRNH